MALQGSKHPGAILPLPRSLSDEAAPRPRGWSIFDEKLRQKTLQVQAKEPAFWTHLGPAAADGASKSDIVAAPGAAAPDSEDWQNNPPIKNIPIRGAFPTPIKDQFKVRPPPKAKRFGRP